MKGTIQSKFCTHFVKRWVSKGFLFVCIWRRWGGEATREKQHYWLRLNFRNHYPNLKYSNTLSPERPVVVEQQKRIEKKFTSFFFVFSDIHSIWIGLCFLSRFLKNLSADLLFFVVFIPQRQLIKTDRSLEIFDFNSVDFPSFSSIYCQTSSFHAICASKNVTILLSGFATRCLHSFACGSFSIKTVNTLWTSDDANNASTKRQWWTNEEAFDVWLPDCAVSFRHLSCLTDITIFSVGCISNRMLHKRRMLASHSVSFSSLVFHSVGYQSSLIFKQKAAKKK